MTYCAELVTFTVADTDVETYLQRRAAAIQEVKSAHPALYAVPFCSRRPDGTWIDVWIYETKDAADAANADAPNLPAFLAMAELLDNVDIEVTEMPLAAEPV